MKTKPRIQALFAVCLFAALNFPLATFAQGSLTPLGPPAPTMKTLDQVEARTPIAGGTNAVTISQRGSYYLTGDISVGAGDAITIAVDNVMLDLNGFSITSTAASAAGSGIVLADTRRNITILNGFITGGVTNNGGVYSGSGFSYGILYSGNLPYNIRVSGVSIAGCKTYGIYLGLGTSVVVESCTVATIGNYRIFASSVSHSSAVDCGLSAINADTAADCYGQSPNGTGVGANAATCCSGFSGTGVGVYAVSANNCYGTSTSSQGIFGMNANNCRGYSTSSQGISVETAINCYGESSQNRGLFANVATACSGHCGGGSYGLFATSIANTCYGYSTSGTGLNAFIAIGCTGNTISYTYHYNMPP